MSTKTYQVVILVLALAAAAAAQEPTRFPLDFTSGPFQLGSCGSFNILETENIQGLQLVWFDENGHPIRAVTHLQAQVTFTNSVTGQSVSGYLNVEENLDAATHLIAQHGLGFIVDLPQRGKLYVEAGNITFNYTTGEVLFLTKTYATKDIITPLCTALS